MSALSSIDWEKIPVIDYINVKKHLITDLPEGVTVSTMCASAKLGTVILYDNVHNYLSLSSDDILTVKRNADSLRTLIPKKKRLVEARKKPKVRRIIIIFIIKLLL